MSKLAIITTHPIQYYAPVFKLLAQKIQLRVFYTLGEQSVSQYDHGFGQQIEWDIPLLAGYDYQFLENISKSPGTHHFNGIINPGICEAVQDFKPEAILIYGWAWKSHLNALRFFKGKAPIYFRGDSTLLDQQKSFRRLLRKYFLKWIYNHIDKAFYVGTANKAYFKHFGLKENQLLFAPHAVDNDRFGKENIIEAQTLRTQLHIKSDEILILFAGKFESKKNPELLLNAFIDLDLKKTHLLFVGNGVLEERLKEKAERLTGNGAFDYAQNDNLSKNQDDGDESLELRAMSWQENLKKRIHFMDFQNQSQMPMVYQACDLFCLPSKGPGETWGLAVNEAMAAGKAVLVSDKVGCAADLVNPGVNGQVFTSGDLTDLKQKLKVLTENKTKLAQMGLASQEMIKDWSFKKQVNQIVEAIQNKHAK
ncbi:glycosyltransferase family 4 protein [Pedobacter sp. PF22-3]|uniref:glycosyltransferase family 4 protein n=1 Tax=Pedobacter sp. PF22-3 TaxID=2994467 RepID=UPI0022476462|nr:glycosyltransferase family 4 protein [Pedobacter sp. PF22-3]MCX2492592.1 glycosyltransferase family 4 protein [Pedobacter sp. PF22-3]